MECPNTNYTESPFSPTPLLVVDGEPDTYTLEKQRKCKVYPRLAEVFRLEVKLPDDSRKGFCGVRVGGEVGTTLVQYIGSGEFTSGLQLTLIQASDRNGHSLICQVIVTLTKLTIIL